MHIRNKEDSSLLNIKLFG